MHFVLKLDRAQVECLRHKLGVSASGIRAVKLCLCLDTGLQALAPLVALQTLDLVDCYKITDAGLQTLAFLEKV